MSDIVKIAKSREIIKELLSTEWKTDDIPILSEEEIRHLYNTTETKNVIYNNKKKVVVLFAVVLFFLLVASYYVSYLLDSSISKDQQKGQQRRVNSLLYPVIGVRVSQTTALGSWK